MRVCKASNLSKAWAMAANEQNIKKWFKEYAEVLQNSIWSPQRTSGLGTKQVCRQC